MPLLARTCLHAPRVKIPPPAPDLAHSPIVHASMVKSAFARTPKVPAPCTRQRRRMQPTALISTPTFPPRIQQPSKTTLPSASGPSGTRMAISSRYTAALAVAGAVTDTFERRSRAKFQGEMSNVPLMCRADSSRDAPTTSGPTSTLKPSTVPPERLPMPTRVIAELITSVASDAADVPSQPDDAADTSPRGSATRDPAGTASKSS
mmetsp:Transcript_27478/g.69943  ORF Transcript_27478/g.69943 Transcript_27478/m.69943 type:complete len:206 (-) Transcript_27478:415-1032(-)